MTVSFPRTYRINPAFFNMPSQRLLSLSVRQAYATEIPV